MKDSNGYLYCINYICVKKDSKLLKFHKSNPFTLQNIKQWLILNNIKLELLSDKYEKLQNCLLFKDEDGYYYTQIFNNLLNFDFPRKFHTSNPYTIQNIKLWCKLNNKPFELISDKYEGAEKKLQWQCLKENCNEKFFSKWGHIYDNHGCPYCNGQQVSLSNCLATRRPDLAVEWHPTKNGDLTPYDVTCGSGKYIWWKCNKNPKHEWIAQVEKRVNDRDCPYCKKTNGGHVLPSEDYNLLFLFPDLCEEWDYNKNNKNPEEYTPGSCQKVWWKCNECGYEWMTTIERRRNNRGCPECNDSNGEKKIKEILRNNNIPYDKQYIFKELVSNLGNPLRFDVSIFGDKEKTKLKMLIEYDGIQHYKQIEGWYTKAQFKTLQYHDKLKNEYCQNNNIKLLRIPYWEFDNIEQIVIDNIRN
jgi:hypothetical protein